MEKGKKNWFIGRHDSLLRRTDRAIWRQSDLTLDYRRRGTLIPDCVLFATIIFLASQTWAINHKWAANFSSTASRHIFFPKQASPEDANRIVYLSSLVSRHLVLVKLSTRYTEKKRKKVFSVIAEDIDLCFFVYFDWLLSKIGQIRS